MYHVRALLNGFTVSQLTTSFPTIASARVAADKAERVTGEKHTVCESLEPTDPRNYKGKDREGRHGFLPLDDDATDDEDADSKPSKPAKSKAK